MSIRELWTRATTFKGPFFKSVIFAVAWFFLPLWLFIIIALYLYFVPPAQAKKLAIPFFVLLIFSILEPQNGLFAIILGATFFYILLIKDLFLIDRKSAYEILVLFLSFILFRDFYIKSGTALTAGSLFYSLLSAIVFGSLVASFIACFESEKRNLRRVAGWIMFILSWQFLIVGLFLPLDFIYQTVVVFLMAVFLVDLIPEYVFGGISRTKILATSSVVFVMLAVVLASARWNL